VREEKHKMRDAMQNSAVIRSWLLVVAVTFARNAIAAEKNERITLDQALKAATLDSAYVLDLESKIGSLEVGKLANIVVQEKKPVLRSSRRHQRHQANADHDEWKSDVSRQTVRTHSISGPVNSRAKLITTGKIGD
jgi:hypothetical protein